MSLASFVMGGFVGIVVPASTLASRFVQMKAKDMPMVVMGQYGSRQHHHADHQQHPGYESSLLHGVQKYGKDCLYTNNSPQSTRSITEFSSVTIAVNMKELRETLVSLCGESTFPYFILPNRSAVFRSDVQRVGFGDAEGVIPSVDVRKGTVHTPTAE